MTIYTKRAFASNGNVPFATNNKQFNCSIIYCDFWQKHQPLNFTYQKPIKWRRFDWLKIFGQTGIASLGVNILPANYGSAFLNSWSCKIRPEFLLNCAKTGRNNVFSDFYRLKKSYFVFKVLNSKHNLKEWNFNMKVNAFSGVITPLLKFLIVVR